ncbi:MAG: hypothetical protein P8X76_05375 [Maritimibacter sp.]
MSSNVIQFPRPLNLVKTETVAQALSAHADAQHETQPAQTATSDASCTQRRPDGRRKKIAKSRSIEPNIQEIPGKNGDISYRVQIRKFANGKSYSFTKTLTILRMAKT